MESLFCPECHNLLDLPGEEDIVTCTVCGARQSASGTCPIPLAYSRAVFENRPVVTRSRPGLFGDVFQKRVVSGAAGKVHNDGATIKERCPKCGNPEMTFHTMQLRSADEGQTVFYVCPKCRIQCQVDPASYQQETTNRSNQPKDAPLWLENDPINCSRKECHATSQQPSARVHPPVTRCQHDGHRMK